jgi:hypothetical protein
MISSYQQNCLVKPIPSAVVMGGVFSAFDVAMGQRITPKSVGSYMAFIYTYNAMQCPMEEIHGRKSALHNALSGGIIGFIGVTNNRIGIPFIDPNTLYRYPFVSPGMAAFAVYGGLGLGLAMIGGKPL